MKMLGRRAELEEKSCPATKELYEKIGHFSRRNCDENSLYVTRNTVFAGAGSFGYVIRRGALL
jgi:hypothetical protein